MKTKVQYVADYERHVEKVLQFTDEARLSNKVTKELLIDYIQDHLVGGTIDLDDFCDFMFC